MLGHPSEQLLHLICFQMLCIVSRELMLPVLHDSETGRCGCDENSAMFRRQCGAEVWLWNDG